MSKSTCELHLEVKVPSEEGKAEFEKALRRVQKVIKLRGFRPGKVPIDIIRKRFKNEVIKDMLRHFLPNLAINEVEKRNISAIDLPIIEDVNVNDDLSIDVKLLVYVWPKIKLANYKKLKLKRKDSAVKDEEIEKALNEYRKMLLPEDKRNDPNLKPEELPELTDEVVKKWGYDSVSQMREQIKKNLGRARESEAKRDIDRQIREFLLKHSSLDVPKAWVDRQFESKLRSFASTLSQMGMSEEQIRQILEQRKEDILKSAEDDVKLFFIIEEIANKEGIEASEEEIEVELEKMAKQYGLDTDKMKSYLKQNKKWDDFCLDVDHDKVWNYLINIGIK